MNEDFADLLRALLNAEARFLVVGAHALAVHGVPRATGDLDVWIDPTPENAKRVWQALVEFGAPVGELRIDAEELTRPDRVLQIGVPPRRIDLLTGVSGLEFADAWERRLVHRIGDLGVPFLSRSDLAINKRASGRAQDLADLEALGEEPRREP